MIVDAGSAVVLKPWPDGMPDGWGDVTTAQDREDYAQTVHDWLRMPTELQVLMFQGFAANPSSAQRRVRLRQSTTKNISSLTAYFPFNAAGLYGGFGTGVIQQTCAVNHEWGHVIDFELRRRREALTFGPHLTEAQTAIDLYATVQPRLGSNVYAKTDITEWFAEFYKGWCLRSRAQQAYATVGDTEAGFNPFDPLVDTVRAYFTSVLPFTGSDLYAPSSLAWVSTNPPVVRATQQHFVGVMLHGNPAPVGSAVRWQKRLVGTFGAWTDLGTGTFWQGTLGGSTGNVWDIRALSTNTVATDEVVFRQTCLIDNSAATYSGNYAFRIPSKYLATVGQPVTLVDGPWGTTQTYQWQSSTNNVSWSDMSGQTNRALTVTPSSAGTVYYRVSVAAGAGVSFGGSCALVAS